MSLHHNPRIVTSGLVLALDAADINSYPGSGTMWYDVSGNSSNATFSESPTIVDKSFYLNYPPAILVDSTDIPINSTSGFTFSFWFKSVSNGGYQYIFGCENGTGTEYFDINVDGYYGYAEIYYSQDPDYYYFKADLPAGQDPNNFLDGWHNFTLVVNNASQTVTAYWNSVSSTITSFDGAPYWPYQFLPTRTSIAVFSGPDGYYNAFEGYGSSTYIYGRALTQAEIQQNFTVQKSRYGL